MQICYLDDKVIKSIRPAYCMHVVHSDENKNLQKCMKEKILMEWNVGVQRSETSYVFLIWCHMKKEVYDIYIYLFGLSYVFVAFLGGCKQSGEIFWKIICRHAGLYALVKNKIPLLRSESRRHECSFCSRFSTLRARSAISGSGNSGPKCSVLDAQTCSDDAEDSSRGFFNSRFDDTRLRKGAMRGAATTTYATVSQIVLFSDQSVIVRFSWRLVCAERTPLSPMKRNSSQPQLARPRSS